jgi:hypothetical protein
MCLLFFQIGFLTELTEVTIYEIEHMRGRTVFKIHPDANNHLKCITLISLNIQTIHPGENSIELDFFH